jgi:hypothetical protein
MRPKDWLVRPFPPGHEWFRILSPGKMPGASGTISFHKQASTLLRFKTRPPARLFVLNESVEHPMLVELLRNWVGDHDHRAPAESVPELVEATASLLNEGAVRLFEDPLVGEMLRPLRSRKALRAVRDESNWWRDEADDTVPPAPYLVVVSITEQGRAALADIARR